MLEPRRASPPRSWGDGVGDRRTHVIEDIRYTSQPDFIDCRCGAHIEAPSPEGLALLWIDHGGKVMGPIGESISLSSVLDRDTLRSVIERMKGGAE